MPDDISDDLRTTLQELQGQNNDNLPATRQPGQLARRSSDVEAPARTAARDVATREQEQPARRESLPANREPDEEDRTEEERRSLTTQEDEQELPGRKAPATPGPLDKPPVTWKGPAKEEWKDLSPAVRQEIARRERQIDTTLTQTADQRKYAEVMFNVIQPYEHHLRAEGANHVQAVDHLMKLAHVMRAGTPQAKAKTLSQLFFAHDVDLDLLNDYIVAGLEGKEPKNDPVLAAVEAQMAPVRAFMQEMQQARQSNTQRVQQSAAQTIRELLDDPEIGDMLEDVREDMADLLDLATTRGTILPLRDAAVRAIMAHPEHSVVYNQRQLAKQAQQQTDKAGRSRRAGASLQDEGAPPASEDDDQDDGTVLGAIKASVRDLSRRR